MSLQKILSMITRILRGICLFLVAVYRKIISPVIHAMMGPNAGCRYIPTCSQYAEEALKTLPLPRALWLILKRVSSCHPWGGHGYDPVPTCGCCKEEGEKKDRPEGGNS